MKFNNIAKSVIAASALTVASFGANSSIISSSVLNVTGFGIEVVEGSASIPTNTWSLENDATFNNVSSGISGVYSLTGGIGDPALSCVGSDCGTIAENDFSLGLLDSTDTLNFAQADSYLIDSQAGVDASSRADVSLTGIANGNSNSADSNIHNSITTTLTFDVETDGTSIGIGYSYVAQLISEIGADMQGPDYITQANSSYSLSFTLSADDGHFIGNDNFIALFLLGTNGSETATQLDTSASLNSSGPKETLLTGLLNGQYTLTIKHETGANINHINVPEPTSVAILGLGLLGFAGAARRRKA